jgi:2',3'-cyclic-nucleotide 2'-phosphodiesterase (5'-nucleotidase family)
MSNMVGTNDSIPARGKRKVVLEVQGVTVGFVGLAEKDWIDTLPDPPENIQYRDFVSTARDIAKVGDGQRHFSLL